MLRYMSWAAIVMSRHNQWLLDNISDQKISQSGSSLHRVAPDC